MRTGGGAVLAYVGTEAAGLVLRLKARLGDAEADVVSECLAGLMTIDALMNLEFVCEFLDPLDAGRCEAAALAPGKSRLPGCSEAQVVLAAIVSARAQGATFTGDLDDAAFWGSGLSARPGCIGPGSDGPFRDVCTSVPAR